jgi:hypothetical protein
MHVLHARVKVPLLRQIHLANQCTVTAVAEQRVRFRWYLIPVRSLLCCTQALCSHSTRGSKPLASGLRQAAPTPFHQITRWAPTFLLDRSR